MSRRRRSSNFSFGAIERQLCPCISKQLKRYGLRKAAEEEKEEGKGEASTSTRKSRFKQPARLDPLSSLPFELFSQICLDLDPGDLFSLSLVNQSLFFRLRTRAANTEEGWRHVFHQHFSKSGKPDAETPEQADARVKANINPIELAFLIDVLRSIEEERGLVVMAQPANAFRRDFERGLQEGHYFFLPKVLAQAALLDAVALNAGFAKKGLEEFTAVRKARLLAERAFLGRFW
ncbi:hypothetical protein JCM10207_008116 [Rhodosporidiobolus poonsookiae]